MKKVLIIGSECKSLMRFRGELLKSFKNINYDVFACAGGKCDQATVWFNEFGINYIPVRISRTGLNPFSDLMFFYLELFLDISHFLLNFHVYVYPFQ